MIKPSRYRWSCNLKEHGKRAVTAILAVALLVSSCPIDVYASANPAPQAPSQRAARHAVPHNASPSQPEAIRQAAEALPDSIPLAQPINGPAEVVEDEFSTAGGRIEFTPVDTVPVLTDSIPARPDEWEPREFEFVPNPTKATWLSALFPGLGQIYNRRYWKLPIIVGGYLGLAYATNWNNSMLRDYTKAYADLLDNDPDTRSYMDLFSPNVKEESLDRAWLQNVIRSRKNYFRRNRDLCIIAMVGVYLLAMVDAYVDASLSHFDITPELSMDVAPALIQDGRQPYPSVGLMWAVNF